MQPQIHLIDETWIGAGPERTSAALADSGMWPSWWPTLQLTVTRDRGLKGIQWAARSRAGVHRALAGTVEVWLEPMHDGVLLHHFVRLDPVDGRPLGRRRQARLLREFGWQGKQAFWSLKDGLEARDTEARSRPPAGR